MLSWPFLRSILWKAIYVVAAAAVAGLAGWLDTNPDVGLWTLDSLKIAVLASVVAALKKFAGSWFQAP